jgi:lipoprotein-releasing system permease protein
MRFTRLLALRYTFGLRKKVAVTLISRFAAFVIGVAVFAFFVVLSVFGGLREFGLQFTHAFDPDIRITSATSGQFNINEDVFMTVQNHPEVALTSATLSKEMILRFEDRTAFANIIGVDSLFYAIVAGESMVGDWVQPGAYELVLGIGVLSQLDGAAYDHPEGITLLVPNKRGAGVLNQQPFIAQSAIVRGVFQIGASIDENTAYAPIDMVQQILRTRENQASALYIKLTDDADEIAVQQDLQKIVGNDYNTKTKAELNPALYKMLQTERVAVIAILTLVVLIALFNVVGAIIMTLLEKKGNIKTLHQLGATAPSLRRVFFMQGLLLSGLGSGIGLLLAILVVWLQKSFAVFSIPRSGLPYPVALEWPSFWTVVLVVGGLTTVVSWLASAVVKGVVRG